MQIFNAFLLTLWLTSERLSDIRERKSVIETRPYNQILAKFEYGKREGSNNAHATDIYYPERENYILAWREWLLLTHFHRQCEKPDC